VASFVITNTALSAGVLESDAAPKRDAAVLTPAASSSSLRVTFCILLFLTFFASEICIRNKLATPGSSGTRNMLWCDLQDLHLACLNLAFSVLLEALGKNPSMLLTALNFDKRNFF
jgi:hypothetical protein